MVCVLGAMVKGTPPSLTAWVPPLGLPCYHMCTVFATSHSMHSQTLNTFNKKESMPFICPVCSPQKCLVFWVKIVAWLDLSIFSSLNVCFRMTLAYCVSFPTLLKVTFKPRSKPFDYVKSCFHSIASTISRYT